MRSGNIREEAIGVFKNIHNVLLKKGVIRKSGTMFFQKFDDPRKFKRSLIGDIDNCLDLIDDLSLLITQDEVQAFKANLSKQLVNIQINILSKYKNKSFNEQDVDEYNRFRTSQLECKIYFLNALKDEAHTKLPYQYLICLISLKAVGY